MGEKFSECFHDKDKVKPTMPGTQLFTACVSVLLYEAFWAREFFKGQKDVDDYKKLCDRYPEYHVPNDYPLHDGTEHCLCPNYWFKYYGRLKGDTGVWLSKLFSAVKCNEVCDKVNRVTGNCDVAYCKNIPGPDKVKMELAILAYKWKKDWEKQKKEYGMGSKSTEE